MIWADVGGQGGGAVPVEERVGDDVGDHGLGRILSFLEAQVDVFLFGDGETGVDVVVEVGE